MEWHAFSGTDSQYSPRLDLAVGPFAIGGLNLGEKYDELSIVHRKYIESLWRAHASNIGCSDEDTSGMFHTVSSQNSNARCFLAIEIENRGSRKHILGGMLNAAALGRFGIMIGWTEESVHMLVRARRYLEFLLEVRKPSLPFSNLLILNREQAEQYL
ncbi:MAG: hypothetical protein IT353_04815 [Gemmatimonadaceae bacterium]|nr:hypothetical protein [Gemmatimonadaceae bacterium]